MSHVHFSYHDYCLEESSLIWGACNFETLKASTTPSLQRTLITCALNRKKANFQKMHQGKTTRNPRCSENSRGSSGKDETKMTFRVLNRSLALLVWDSEWKSDSEGRSFGCFMLFPCRSFYAFMSPLLVLRSARTFHHLSSRVSKRRSTL